MEFTDRNNSNMSEFVSGAVKLPQKVKEVIGFAPIFDYTISYLYPGEITITVVFIQDIIVQCRKAEYSKINGKENKDRCMVSFQVDLLSPVILRRSSEKM